MKWETIIGLAGAALTTAAFVPQALKTLREKSTGDISLAMYITMNLGVALWLAYGIAIGDLPVIIANSVTIIFTGTILFLKIKYK